MGPINKLMNMFNIGGNEQEYEEEEYEDIEDTLEDEPQYTRTGKKFSDIEESPYSARSLQSKVIPMNTAVSSNKMVITQPNCFEDVQEIGDYFKSKKSVIINLESVSKEEARRILDFMYGATFIVEGTVQKVSNLIYLVTPKNIEIQNDVDKNQYKQKISFSWMK